MRLVVATRNQHKLDEIREILAETPYTIASLTDYPDAPVVQEDGDTFELNALKKARQIAQHTQCLTLADDSGLVVDALDGAPGVHSKRFGGPTDAERNHKLLRLMEPFPREQRAARFVCVAALVWPDGRHATVRGTCEGRIGWEPRGDAGFGYDPIFVVPEYDRTFAELGLTIKNQISHRAIAFHEVREILERRGI